jgi:uncharacterized membrane protein
MSALTTPIGRAVASGQLTSGGAGNQVNVRDMERLLSLVGGGLLVAEGWRRGSLAGFGLAAIGSSLLYRGLSGHCPMYAALGTSTAQPHSRAASIAAGHGAKVTRIITVNRSIEEVYRVWRDLEGLPRFMSHLLSVKRLDGNRSHWIAQGPAGMTAEWDAEIINEEPNRLLAWRSLQGSRVATAGSVTFQPALGGGGTDVHVTLKYEPPAGKIGSWAVWFLGESPEQQVAEDLRRFKQLMEAGAIGTIERTTYSRV